MYIKIRKQGRMPEEDLIITISKTATVEKLTKIIQEKCGIGKNQQLLLYKGKQLNIDNTLFEYDVQLNDVIQLIVKLTPSVKITKESDLEHDYLEERRVESTYFFRGDFIDYRDENGAWFEGILIDIVTISKHIEKIDDSLLIYKCKRDLPGENPVLDLEFCNMRPRCYQKLTFNSLKRNQIVLVNYNIEEPDSLGFWYDLKILKLSQQDLTGSLLLGHDFLPIKNVLIKLPCEIYHIEKSSKNRCKIDYNEISTRTVLAQCIHCMDLLEKLCLNCGCNICGNKNDIDKLLMCDECDKGYHMYCLNPPLVAVPLEEDWYCPKCKTNESEIVRIGEKPKMSAKKLRLKSLTSSKQKDWDRGMACVGHTKQCTIVPMDHLGPIPGVEVGMTWKFRFQVGEAGVHRPIVAGIHGIENGFAYSLVLSGSYEDDLDFGSYFLYTGAGGRNLATSNRRHTFDKRQHCDQTLTRTNRALANNCHAAILATNASKLRQNGGTLATKESFVNAYDVKGKKKSEGNKTNDEIEEDKQFLSFFAIVCNEDNIRKTSVKTATVHSELVSSNVEGMDNGGGSEVNRTVCVKSGVRLPRKRVRKKKTDVELLSALEKGGEAIGEDWRLGKPVRVVRNYKGGGRFAPKEGNRYDGIYKVVKFFPEIGKSGFIIWRYLLRRDDLSPAPWEQDGREYPVIYPDGYLTAMADRHSTNNRGIKRKSTSDMHQENCIEFPNKRINNTFDIDRSPVTNNKITADDTSHVKIVNNNLKLLKLDAEIEMLIEDDTFNDEIWSQLNCDLLLGKVKFMQSVSDKFMCVCCQELVFKPLILPCKHIVCFQCLKRSFAAEIFSCPCCRFNLGEHYEFRVNDKLATVLVKLFPGYEVNREI